MIHHKHKRLTFLSIFFALPGLIALSLLLGAYVMHRAFLNTELSGDSQVFYIMIVAGVAYFILLIPAFMLLKKMEHEPYARRVRVVLGIIALYDVYLFVLAGSASYTSAFFGIVLLLCVGWLLDRMFPHYL